MRGAGHAKLDVLARLVRREPVQGLLVLLAGELLIEELFPSAGRHQQERVERRRAKLDGQVQDGRQFVNVVPADGRVDLEGQMRPLGGSDALQAGRECPVMAAKSVVRPGRRPVERDGYAANAGLHEPGGSLVVEEQPAGPHHHGQIELAGIGGNLVDVRAEHRLPAGQDDDGLGKRGDVLKQGAAFLGGELVGAGGSFSRGAAVAAAQRTGARQLPGDQAGLIRDGLAKCGTPFHYRTPMVHAAFFSRAGMNGYAG